jgi:hypothetical protein
MRGVRADLAAMKDRVRGLLERLHARRPGLGRNLARELLQGLDQKSAGDMAAICEVAEAMVEQSEKGGRVGEARSLADLIARIKATWGQGGAGSDEEWDGTAEGQLRRLRRVLEASGLSPEEVAALLALYGVPVAALVPEAGTVGAGAVPQRRPSDRVARRGPSGGGPSRRVGCLFLECRLLEKEWRWLSTNQHIRRGHYIHPSPLLSPSALPTQPGNYTGSPLGGEVGVARWDYLPVQPCNRAW